MHPSRERLYGYAVGTIAEEPAETISDHVADCPECEETLRELEGQSDAVVAALEAGRWTIRSSGRPAVSG